MIILAIIFSILFVCSLLFRYRYEIRDIKIKTDGKVARTALKSSVNRKLIFSAIFLLIISLSFNALLSLGSLEKLYVKSTVSQYQIIGTDLQRNIDRSLRYGKKLDKFVRMNIMLSDTQYSLTTKYLKDQTQTQWQDIDLNVSIALPDWKMIYSTNKDFVGKYIPERVQINYTDVIKNHESNNESNWTKYKDRYYITLPVKGGERKEWAGTVIIDFNDTQIRGFLKNIFFNNMKIIGAILVVGSILLFICLNLIVNRAKNELPRIFISVVMLFIIGLSQAIFSFINSSEFKKFYLQINIQKAEIMTAMLKEDVDYFLDKGVKINKLVKMENILKEVIDVSPELEDISIYDENNDILHLANKDHAIDYVRSKKELKALDLTHSERGSEFQLKKNLNQTIKDDNEYSQSVTKGSIITNISKKALFDKIFEIRIDSITVLIISFLFMVELLIMIFRIIQSSDHSKGAQPKIEFSDIRPVMFIYFFSFDLCISFLPLFMEQLYTPMFGLSKDIVLSLPIALEMFFAGITTIIAGWLLDRINWHLPFIYGLIICSIGSFYSWLSPDAYHLLFSRCLAGVGYGFSFMAAQGFIISYTDNKTKTQGLTQLFAGLMAGSICGGAAGAMIADRIGYAPIFFISGMLLFVTVLYTLYFMRAGFKKKVVQKRTDEESVEKDSKGLKLIMKFIFNRNIFSLLLLGILPTAFSIVGFINFFYPVYLNRLGETQSNIGRIYMIYGLCLIYIAPLLSKFVDRSDNKKLFIVITGLIGGMAFTSFYYTAGLWATVITVLLLGISSSFDASRTYALNLKITKTLGEGVAMGIFNLAEKVGQVVGPLIFGLFFITTSVNNTMAIFGIVYIIITLLFMVTAQSDKKIKMQNR
jgi:predicted MFS family arabinose efflux permease